MSTNVLREEELRQVLIKLYSRRKRARVSACPVIPNVWIGDINAAVEVAIGAVHLPTKRRTHDRIVAVFNASSIECSGLTLEGGYQKHGIGYDTLFNADTGVCLADSCEDTAETLPFEMAELGNVERTVPVRLGKETIMAHPRAICTAELARFLFYVAAYKIEILVSKYVKSERDCVLVHCARGRNRSAACIAAYMILALHVDPAEAIEMIRTGVLADRGESALTNITYIEVLLDLDSQKPRYEEAITAAEVFFEQYQSVVKHARQLAQTEAKKSTSIAVGCRCESPHPIEKLSDIMWLVTRQRRGCDKDGMRCSVCGAAPLHLFACAICRHTLYCGPICQKMDWFQHRLSCIPHAPRTVPK